MQSGESIIKKISGDFILNFIASAVVTAVMQLLMYPLINRVVGNIIYGNFLTIIGIINTISAVVGTTLNNIRLIRETEYKEKRVNGDFNLLLIVMIIIAILISIPIFLMFDADIVEVILIEVLLAMMSIRGYWSVEYRLRLNYKNILFSNIVLSAGYLLGCWLLIIFNNWLVPFLAGEIAALLYLAITTSLRKESYNTTVLFKRIVRDAIFIGCSTLSANVLIYLDRLVLYPLLGGNAVTTYTVASVGGKFLGIVATPLAGVLLSYYSQPDFIMTRRKFWFISLITMGTGILGLGVIIPISPYLIKILYPLAYEDALPIVPLACIAGIMGLICNFIQPSILKIAPTKWQLIKEVVYGGVYIGAGYILLKQYGMIGFCVASVMALVMKMLILLLLGQVYCKKNKKAE